MDAMANRMSDEGPLLELRDIKKTYRNLDNSLAASVLEGVSFRLFSGEAVAVQGPSGSGKTTLLQLCALLDAPDSGALAFKGSPTGEWDESRRCRYRSRDIGFVFQEHRLLPQLTVRENVLLPGMAPEGKAVGADSRARADDLLGAVGMLDKATRYPGQLSTGERQRVAVARALFNDPPLVLADEPTGSLDRENGLLVSRLLRELTRERGTALLMVTHSEEQALMMDRRIFLAQGMVVS